jgi:SAM-dependent methyltransferase
VGIAWAFLGNRYFVFRHCDQDIVEQVVEFVGLYLSIVLLNGAVLFLWTDQLGYNYKIGFLLCAGFQVSLGYFYVKKYVFGHQSKQSKNNILNVRSEADSTFSYTGKELENFLAAVNWKTYWSSQIQPFLGNDVLELGAGIGATVLALNYNNYRRWVAVEPDKEMCAILERLSINKSFGSGFEIVNGTSASLRNDDIFDTILYIDVLEHIEDDASELAIVCSHLAEGGHLIIVAPAHDFLYTSFDKKVGHYRRYNKTMLYSITPSKMVTKKFRYLDSVGLFASLANKFFLKSDTPSEKQIQFWDKFMVRTSRVTDIVTGYTIGKTIVYILQKKTVSTGEGS